MAPTDRNRSRDPFMVNLSSFFSEAKKPAQRHRSGLDK
jgi:hypothetical protein